MDLTLTVGNTILNIRVAVIIKTSKGYILEKHKDGYYFLLGGRIKAGESSEDGAKREVLEEIGVAPEGLKLKAIIENFFDTPEQKIHEICFVYTANDVNVLQLEEGLGEYPLSEIEHLDLRPNVTKEIITSTTDGILHFILQK